MSSNGRFLAVARWPERFRLDLETGERLALPAIELLSDDGAVAVGISDGLVFRLEISSGTRSSHALNDGWVPQALTGLSADGRFIGGGVRRGEQ